MPELPEVETICQGLLNELGVCETDGPTVTKLVIRKAQLRVPIPKRKIQDLVGCKIRNIHRRAKYLLFDFGDQTMLSHLGMSGSWRIINDDRFRKHDHFVLVLNDGRNLVYHDPRRFGLIDVFETSKVSQSKWLQHLGPEPLSKELNGKYLFDKSRTRKINVKNFIMDQKNVVGVGNIYASEALFMAHIRPHKKVKSMNLQKWEELTEVIRKILQKAIAMKGTTLRDYVQASGEKGEFKNQLFVYDRYGLPCQICHGMIKRSVINARSTYWCPNCQI